MQGDAQRAGDVALQLAAIFPHRFYIELQRAGRPDDEAHVAAAVQLAARLNLPVVATHPVQFTTEDDYEAHEARVCISEGEILGNQRRVRKFTREQYFKTAGRRWRQLFADVPSAVANTLEIAKRCNLVLELGKPQAAGLPDAQRHADRRVLPLRLARGPEGAAAAPVPGRGASATRRCRATWSGWSSRSTPS